MDTHMRPEGRPSWGPGFQPPCSPWPVHQFQQPMPWGLVMVQGPHSLPHPHPSNTPHPSQPHSPYPPSKYRKSWPAVTYHHAASYDRLQPTPPQSPRPATPPQPSLPPQTPPHSPQPPLDPNSTPFVPRAPSKVRLVNPCIPLYYLTFPTPYYVTLHGGVMMERPTPVHRPTPVYPNRKRAMPSDSGSPDDDVDQTSALCRMLGDEETPKKNKLETSPQSGHKKTFDNRNLSSVGQETDFTQNDKLDRLKVCTSPDQSQHTSTSGSMLHVIVIDSDESESPDRAKVPKLQTNLIEFPSPPSALTELKSPNSKRAFVKYEGKKDKTSKKVGESGVVSEKPERKNNKLRKNTGNLPGPKESFDINSLEPSQKKSPTPDIETDLYNKLQELVPTKDQLKNLGYPLPSVENPRITLIYKQEIRSHIPLKKKPQDKKKAFESTEKTCVRCGESFYVKGVTYLTTEKCQYHWGKVEIMENYQMRRTCCLGDMDSEGCTTGKLHVWSGITDGMNVLKGFVKPPKGVGSNIVGLDCEMIYTKAGMEVAKVAVVNVQRKVVYEALVRPQHEVIDYNTRFSGVSLDDYKENNPKPFHDVQRELLKYIKSGTIVIGHSLENDLRVLKIVHPLVVDTAVIYPHLDGFPFRRSLKDLAHEVLGVPIQSKESGHDPAEDAGVAVALVLFKVKMDQKIR